MFSLKGQKNKKAPSANRPSQNPRILDVNLIKDEIKILFNWQKNIAVLFVALIVVGALVTELYFGLDWWAKQEDLKAQSLRDDIVSVNSDIGKIKSRSDDALAFKDKSVQITSLLDNHVYFSNFFTWLEKNTLSTVTYGDFSGNLLGKYSLSAKGKTYADVSWQVKSLLNDDKTISAEVSNAGLFTPKNKSSEEEEEDKKEQIAEVIFDLSLEVNPNIFKK